MEVHGLCDPTNHKPSRTAILHIRAHPYPEVWTTAYLGLYPWNNILILNIYALKLTIDQCYMPSPIAVV